MPTDTTLVLKYANDQKKKYPDALTFGMSFLSQLITAFSAQNYPFDYTPASMVSLNMLNDFEFILRYRRNEEVGSFDVDPQEVQGYVDSVALYTVACFAVANNVPYVFGDSLPSLLPHFDTLPGEVQAKCQKFTMDNGMWALKELREQDLVDGRGFMDRLVKRIAVQSTSRLYQRGSRTARDTLLLYLEVIEAFLAGKFRR